MKSAMTPRECWLRLAAGEDVGPVVSPLCDNWSLDLPYTWPYPEPDPFPPGHPQHMLSQQIAMAGLCGWTPSFLTGLPVRHRNPDIAPETKSSTSQGVTRAETRIRTPLGDLTCITESQISSHTVKRMLETEEDYRRMAWLLRAQADFDEDFTVRESAPLRAAIGDRGVWGTWFGPPISNIDRDEMFFHLLDWPEACEELRAANLAYQLKLLPAYRRAGLDYLFYCVDGTEWISPDYFRDRILGDTLTLLGRWRELGGFVLWHSCGHVKKLIEDGFYNQCLPEIFETVSEPPVGTVPSLRWARERLDRRIVTKGNLALNILLQGTEDDVRREVCRIKEQTRGWRHIVGLSDDVLNNTPLANCRAFVEEALRG